MALPFSHYLTAYGIAAVVFLGLDAIWLGTMASRLYRPSIGHLMADGFSVAPAVIFYLLYLVGMMIFAIGPALEARRPMQALVMGALLGLFCYATYDLTNQATLKDWPWQVTVADLIWGTFVTGVASALTTRLTLAWRG